MLSRRSIMGLLAGASAAPASVPLRDGAAGAAGAAAPVALGARSVLDLLPGELADAVRARRATADLAPFINRAVAAIDAGGTGGTLFFPAGTYPVSTLDLTRTRASEAGITLVGAGRGQTIIVPVAPGRVLVDAAGRDNLSLLDLEIFSGDHLSSCGLLLARHADRPTCNRNRLAGLRIRGSFSAAAAVSIAAESNGWSGCLFENSHAPAAHRCFATANDPAAIRLPGLASRIVAGPNTDNVMTDCEFYAPFDGARPVGFVGSAGYVMLACTVIAGNASGTRLVTYEPRGSIFSGPVAWQSPHLEVYGRDTVVHALAGPGTCYYRGINSNGGNYQVGDGAVLMGQVPGTAGRPIVQSSTWTVPLVAQGVANAGVRVYALVDCDLALRSGESPGGRGVGDIEVTGFATNSRVVAASARVAQTVTKAACL